MSTVCGTHCGSTQKPAASVPDAALSQREHPTDTKLGVHRDGAVTAMVNRYANFPKFHFDIGCRGLERAHLEVYERQVFTSAAKLFERTTARPCRMCALLDCLVAYLPSQFSASGQLVTFSSQSNPTENDVWRYDYTASTPTGQERLERLTAELALPLVTTSVGPVTWARLSEQAIEVLSRNLRTFPAPFGAVDPDEDQMFALWALITDNPPEQGGWDEIVWQVTRVFAENR